MRWCQNNALIVEKTELADIWLDDPVFVLMLKEASALLDSELDAEQFDHLVELLADTVMVLHPLNSQSAYETEQQFYQSLLHVFIAEN